MLTSLALGILMMFQNPLEKWAITPDSSGMLTCDAYICNSVPNESQEDVPAVISPAYPDMLDACTAISDGSDTPDYTYRICKQIVDKDYKFTCANPLRILMTSVGGAHWCHMPQYSGIWPGAIITGGSGNGPQ